MAVIVAVVVAGCGHKEPAASRTAAAPVPRGLLVYSKIVSKEDYVGGGGRTDLFLRRIPGTQVQRLTDHRAHPKLNLGGAIEQPQFSPDGKQVLFLSNCESAPASDRQMYTDAPPYANTLLNIWLLDRATSAIRAATHGDLGWEDVHWSPDGRYFSAVYPTRSGMLQDSPPCDVYIFNARTLQKRKVAHSTDAYEQTAWRPNSRHLLVEVSSGGNFRLDQIACPDGRTVPFIAGLKNAADYVVSPNGRYVTFVDTHDGTLHLARLGQGQPKTILRISIPEVAANADWSRSFWSPDGKRLAAIEANTQRLYVVDTEKPSSEVLTTFTSASRFPVRAGLESWSRNGDWVIVSISSQADNRPVHTGITAVSAQDGRLVVLTAPFPVPGGLDWHEE